jgi:hypothetical protein
VPQEVTDEVVFVWRQQQGGMRVQQAAQEMVPAAGERSYDEHLLARRRSYVYEGVHVAKS